MSYRKWMDNVFWETDEKQMLNCILEMEDDVGRVTRQVMKLRKVDEDGNDNPDFVEVVEALGDDLITENTNERNSRKKREAEEKKQQELEHAKARKLSNSSTTNSKHLRSMISRTRRIVNSNLNFVVQIKRPKLTFTQS